MAFNFARKSDDADATLLIPTESLRQFCCTIRAFGVTRVSSDIYRKVWLCVRDGYGVFGLCDGRNYAEAVTVGDGAGDINLGVDSRKFMDMVTHAPVGMMLVERTGSRLRFKVNLCDCGTLDGISGADRPKPPPMDGKDTMSVTARYRDIAFTAQHLCGVCTVDSPYPALCGVLAESDGDIVTFTASDSRMLVCTGMVPPKMRCVLPAKAFAVLSQTGANATLTVSNAGFTFSTPRLRVYGEYVRGQYPDVHRIYPKEFSHEYRVDVGRIRKAVERLSLRVSPTPYGSLPVMLVYGGVLDVSAVPHDYEFDHGGIKMDANRLLELMKRFGDGDSVTFQSTGVLKCPTVWTDAHGISMLTPLR